MDWKTKLYNRITELWQATAVEEVAGPIVVFSDFHMGDGGKVQGLLGDSFVNYIDYLDNLTYYINAGYTIVINGDLEDTWKFSRERIRKAYSAIYRLHEDLEKGGRFYRIAGNHDFAASYPEAVTFSTPLGHVFVTHGNQGDLVNDRWWILGYLWTKYLSWQDPYLEAKRLDKVTEVFAQWANDNKVNTIVGHSHRQGHRGYYWNVGCEIHPGQIECIEVTDRIELKTWRD